MAEVFDHVNGKQLEKFLAVMPGVQASLAEHAFDIAARAEVLLAEHRQDGHARIERAKGHVDHYVILNDERGQLAAKSIEYGRKAGTYLKVVDGEEVEVAYGAMEGLYILTRASNLPKKKRPKVRMEPDGEPA